MREPYDIIIAPVVTEKTAGQMDGGGRLHLHRRP
jgi:ribosomal protein L23